ncbi:hypothetical protein D3C80_1974090 [compost metagenome]
MQQRPPTPFIEERSLIPDPLFHTQRTGMAAQDVGLDWLPVSITLDAGGERFRVRLSRGIADPIGLNQLDAG